jgi:type IV secretory pathway TraG/TraD family ATPase VirD4
MTMEDIRLEGQAGRMGAILTTVVADGPGGKEFRMAATKNRERLLGLLARAPQTATAANLLNDERTGADVLSAIATKLKPLEATADCWHDATKKLSLQDWLRGESMLVLGDSPVMHNSAAPLRRAIFNRLADLILSQESSADSADQRTWVFLDDIRTAGPLTSLPALIQRGRRQGVCVAFGMAEVQELQGLYGPQAVEEFSANCSHRTAMRPDDSETAAWVERHFGPPLQASDLMCLPPTGPKHGFTAFHYTPKAGTYVAHKTWERVVAHLSPHENAAE